LDEKQTPIFRVAFRNLKDFAFSFNKDNKIYWRYFLVDKDFLEEFFQIQKNEEITEDRIAKKEIAEKSDETKESLFSENKIDSTDFVEDLTIKKKTLEKKIIKSSFLDEVKLFLSKKEIVLKEFIDDSKHEINALVIIHSILGNLNYRLIAKNKKSISDGDLLTAIQKANNEKYPLYLLINGKLTKKAKEIFEEYKNLIFIDYIE